MIRLVPTNLNHVDEIFAIEQESFVDPWSKSSIEYEITHEYSICMAAIDEGGNVLGYATMRHVINEGHINNIAVVKTNRRQGVGMLLLEGLINEARCRGMIGLTLEVRTSNQAAIKLYEKYGFAVEGIRKNYYFHPSEDALIMWKHLSLEEHE